MTLARRSEFPCRLLPQKDRGQANDILHIHVSVPVRVKKLGKDGIYLPTGLRGWDGVPPGGRTPAVAPAAGEAGAGRPD